MYLKNIIGILVVMLLLVSFIVSSRDSSINMIIYNNSDMIGSETFNYDFIENAPEAGWFSWGPSNPLVQLYFDVFCPCKPHSFHHQQGYIFLLL